jgi:3-oxoacyl-[acyl-carrier-protein] synthase-3
MIRFRILGSGSYRPRDVVASEVFDRRFGLPVGTTAERSGVHRRHQAAPDETASQMAACAARAALGAAGLQATEIDALVAACGTNEQAMPFNAALLHRQLGLQGSGLPAFDIGSSCLSFVVALDVTAHLLSAGRFRRVLVVSSDIASRGLDPDDFETATLFGDGAAAVVVGLGEGQDSGRWIASRFATYSDGAHLCEIRAGGSRYHPRTHPESVLADHLFHMDGKAVFKLALQVVPGFIAALLADAKIGWDDIDLVIPHQASRLAIEHMRRRLGVAPDRVVSILETHGNQVAASIGTALHHAVTTGRLTRGRCVLLLGTAAGFSVGGIVLEY